MPWFQIADREIINMFREFFEKRKTNKALKEWHNSPLGKALAKHSREYFYGDGVLAYFSEENKERLIGRFYQTVFDIAQAENPFLKMREVLASYVCSIASYQVLCLTEEEKADSNYADCPYISGSLYRHIEDYVKYNDELGELKWKNPDMSSKDLISFCNARCALYAFYVNGMNYVRLESDDFDDKKDWLIPFIRSMLISEEYQVREKLNLPNLLPDSLEALKYSTFLNLVINGHSNPFYQWEKSYSKDDSTPSR